VPTQRAYVSTDRPRGLQSRPAANVECLSDGWSPYVARLTASSSRTSSGRQLHADVPSSEVVIEREPSLVAFANGWVITGLGGPRRGKAMTALETPPDPGLDAES
jgi:hypothetical protein